MLAGSSSRGYCPPYRGVRDGWQAADVQPQRGVLPGSRRATTARLLSNPSWIILLLLPVTGRATTTGVTTGSSEDHQQPLAPAATTPLPPLLAVPLLGLPGSVGPPL